MGSLNTNGTPIQQARNTTRQLGRGYTISADGVELSTTVTSGNLGPQLNVGIAQHTTQKLFNNVKVTRSTDDTTVLLVRNSGLVDL